MRSAAPKSGAQDFERTREFAATSGRERRRDHADDPARKVNDTVADGLTAACAFLV